MPRIDPWQLLKCLSVLLTPNGGIKSSQEVARLVNLMTKFSKKLVSKCIYVQILKVSQVDLLDMFMSLGGWNLVCGWLDNAIDTKNWPLTVELLEFLEICPVTTERLASNKTAKGIALLTKDCDNLKVRNLAVSVRNKWQTMECDITTDISTLQMSFDGSEPSTDAADVPQPMEVDCLENGDFSTQENKENEDEEDGEESEGTKEGTSEESDTGDTVGKVPNKLTIRVGNQIVTRLYTDSKTSEVDSADGEVLPTEPSFTDLPSSCDSINMTLANWRLKITDKLSGDDEKSPKKTETPVVKEEKKKRSSSSHSSRAPKKAKVESKPPKPSHKDTLQEKRDKETLEKLKMNVNSLTKIGRIPKKSNSSSTKSTSESPKKDSSDIDVPRPKTVKTFSSKFRSIGLDEEVKPPPPRSSKTADRKLSLEKSKSLPKRPPPPVPKPVVTDKKSKLSISSDKKDKEKEKPGGIKLIPAKPKNTILESNMFMDALMAGSSFEPRKKKRRNSSTSKDSDVKPKEENKSESKNTKPTSPDVLSPTQIKPTFKFYQDTLETKDEEKESKEEQNDSNASEEQSESMQSMDDDQESASGAGDRPIVEGELKGVLVYHRSSLKPKKSVTWREESKLKEVYYFELDENERANVSKTTFLDMKQQERNLEREGFQKARKLAQEDNMEEKTLWQQLIPVTLPPTAHIPGRNSKERDIQAVREKSVLQALYFSRDIVPPTAAEPDVEIVAPNEIVLIPIDDQSGTPENINDYRQMPWPEPKPLLDLAPAASFPPADAFGNRDLYGAPETNSSSGGWRSGDGTVYPDGNAQGGYRGPPPPMPPYPNDQFHPDYPNQGPPNWADYPPEQYNNYPPQYPDVYHDGMGMPPPPPHMHMPRMQGGGRGGPMMHPQFRGGPPPGMPPMGHMPRYGPPRGGGRDNSRHGGRGGASDRGIKQLDGKLKKPFRSSGNSSRGRGAPRTPCKHFMSGYCRNGNDCTFLHPGINGPL